MNVKIVLAIVTISLIVVLCFANSPLMWQEGGIPVRQGDEIWWTGAVSPLGEDKVLVVWSDTRSGYRYIWAQAIDENGKVWEEDVYIGSLFVEPDGTGQRGAGQCPVSTSDKRCPHYPEIQLMPEVMQTSDGNIVIAWIEAEYHFEEENLYAQKITGDGELLWGDGILIAGPYASYKIKMAANSEGGVHIIWGDYRSHTSYDLYGMHLNRDGQPYSDEWVQNGLVLAEGRGNQHFQRLCPDGKNGFILAYINEVDNMLNLHIKRVSASGEILWERALAAGVDDYANVIVAQIDEEHFGFAYTDRRDGFYKVYVNIVDIDGEDVWETPLPVDAEAHGSPYGQRKPEIAGTTDGRFAVVWEDYRTGVSDVYAQMFNLAGERIFSDRGTAVAINELDQYQPKVKSAADGNVIIVWQDGRVSGHPAIDIYAQKMNSAGEALWEENGRQMSQPDYMCFDPEIVLIGENLYFLWGDHKTGSVAIKIQGYDTEDNQIFSDNGEPIIEGISGSISDHTAVRNGDYVYVVWVDERYGHLGKQIKVQKIDGDGNMLFAENGISVTVHTGAHQQNSYRAKEGISVVPHHSGGIALTWEEDREEVVKVYAQAINSEGEMLWGEKGMSVSLTNDYFQGYPIISRRGTGYVVVYTETDGGSFVENLKAQLIVNGTRAWGDEGVFIIPQTNIYQGHFIVSYVLGGEYIIWRRGFYNIDYAYYIKRIDENGDPFEGWDEYGTVIVDYPDYIQTRLRAVMADEGIVVLWEDLRAAPGHPLNFSIYGQLINPDGEIQWQENGIPIADYDNDQSWITAQYDDGYVYLVWRDSRESTVSRDIAFQKINMYGNPLWGEPAPYVISNRVENENPIIHKSDKSLLVVWENNYGETGVDLYMQLASAQTGELFWGEEGKLLIADLQRQVSPRIIGLDNQTAMIIWEDCRSAAYSEFSNLYAQKVDMFTELSVEDAILPSQRMELFANFPNPFNPDTNIAFNQPHNEKVSLKIYNVKGQLVRTLLNGDYLENGRHNIVWNGKDESGKTSGSGVYFYQLEGERDSFTRKMVLIK